MPEVSGMELGGGEAERRVGLLGSACHQIVLISSRSVRPAASQTSLLSELHLNSKRDEQICVVSISASTYILCSINRSVGGLISCLLTADGNKFFLSSLLW